MDTPSTSVEENCSRVHAINRTSQSLAKFGSDATATRRRNSEPPAQAHGGPGRAEYAPESGQAGAMEQRLAEFREARKRAGLVSQPSMASQGEQTSAAKAEAAAATPKTAMVWLRRFLKWKASPAIMRARPNQDQEEAQQPPQSAAVPLPSSRHQSLLTNITFLKVLLWLVLLGLFVELEFGLAYFVLSMFYWMYVGTRGPEEKKEGEKSAYSVFNPRCEAIQGTLTAEQLERELQLRPPQGR